MHSFAIFEGTAATLKDLRAYMTHDHLIEDYAHNSNINNNNINNTKATNSQTNKYIKMLTFIQKTTFFLSIKID